MSIDTTDIRLRQQIHEADIVQGVDLHDPEHKALFYGRELCELIVASKQRVQVAVLRVMVDFDPSSDDLEALYALCVAIKGSCCYQSYSEAAVAGHTDDRL